MDKKSKISNLYKALYSHLEFSKYIISYGSENVDFENIDFNLLIALFSGNYIESALNPYIEKIINDKGKVIDVKLLLIPEVLDSLASIIAKNNGNGYTLGELSYRNASVLLDIIRNKLAHGAFNIENDMIIFEEKGKLGVIDINKLINLVFAIDKVIGHDSLYEENINIRTFPKFVSNMNVYGKPSFKKFCDNLYVLKIKDKPKEGYKRTISYNKSVKQIINKVNSALLNNGINSNTLEKTIDSPSIKTLLDLNNIEMSFDLNTVKYLDYYKIIENNYLNNIDIYKGLNGNHLCDWISNRVLKLEKGKYQNYNLNKGLLIDILFLTIMRDDSIYDFSQIISKFDEKQIIKPLLFEIDNAVIGTVIVSFNSFFQFGLEDELSIKNQESLYDLIQGNSIDFSLFNLSSFDDPNMIIRNDFESFYKEIEQYKKEVEKYKLTAKNKKDAIDSYIKYNKEQNEEELKGKQEKYNEELKKLEEAQNKVNLCNNYLNNMDLDKYIKNYNIITYIRNAFAHGNVFIDEHVDTDDFEEKKVLLINEYNGVKYYEKEMSLQDFASLSNINNLRHLINFYVNKNDFLEKQEKEEKCKVKSLTK